MINNYFGFTCNPFCQNVEEKDVFKWKDFENALTRLDYFLKEGGIFLLTGLIGSGKTTALRCFSRAIDPNKYRVIYSHNSLDSKRDFYRSILLNMDINPPHCSGDARNMLRKHFLELYFVKRIKPIIIFDEAQNMNGYILEEIRLLSNFDFDRISPVLFIIAGHNVLKQRLALNENEALNQRLSLRFHFQGMSMEETAGYINYCLNKANSTSAIFTDDVIKKIHETSLGIPRKINTVCKCLLLSAMTNGKKIADELVFDSSRGEWE